ncbi:MAG: hypothetical protein IJO75_01655 [Clostridia bacterium]|nr:hypothetical protein [Clostridia bacterium]
MALFSSNKKIIQQIDITKGNSFGTSSVEGDNAHANPWKQRRMRMDDEILRLCYELSGSSELFSRERWIEAFDHYIGEYDRLLYSSISNYIFGLQDEGFTTFATNIENVLDYEMDQVSDNNPDSVRSNRIRVLLKFYDHIQLAHMQFALFTQNQKGLEAAIDKKLEPALAKSSKELTSQLVGLVAIFTALSFIIFGGISSLESLFAFIPQNSSESVIHVVIVAIAWSFCILNLLFAFMYFILNITGKKPELSLQTGNAIQKYPLVFICNYCLLVALLICVAVLVGIKTGIIPQILSSGIACRWLFGSIGLAIIIVGIILLRCYKAKLSAHNKN